MNRASRTFARASALAALALVALALAAPSASAQVPDLGLGGAITIAAGEFDGMAIPGGDGATAPVTITYSCASFSGDITVDVTTPEGGGTATVDVATFPAATFPACNPPSDVMKVVNVTVTADMTKVAGSDILVNVTVTGSDVTGTEASDSVDIGPIVGPYVDVTFAVPVPKFEIKAGESANATLTVTSKSNDMVMAMPSMDGLPATWKTPNLPPTNIEAPAGGTEEKADIVFQIDVPADQPPGDVTLQLSVFAHSMLDGNIMTDTEQFPITVTVLEGASTDEDAEESPVPSVVPLAVLLVAGVALLRRRA